MNSEDIARYNAVENELYDAFTDVIVKKDPELPALVLGALTRLFIAVLQTAVPPEKYPQVIEHFNASLRAHISSRKDAH